MQKYMKVTEYAKMMGIHRLTVTKNFHKGLIPGYQDETTKTIYIENPEYATNKHNKPANKAILYARVSSTTNKPSLDEQINRMRAYAAAKGYTVADEVKEIASGLNDQRPKLQKILKRNDYDILISEHKERLTRFGFGYLETLLAEKGVTIDIINQAENKDEELMNDFISIVTSFCHRIYGRNRKKKTEEIISNIKSQDEE